MSSIYKYYLDGVHMPDPISWDKWEETIRADFEQNATLETIDSSAEFTGRAYEWLWAKFISPAGHNSETTLVVKEQYAENIYKTIFTGIIFTSDIEFDRRDTIARAKIQDNGFYARINNNKSLEVPFEATKTKSGFPYIIQNARTYLNAFNPCDNTRLVPGISLDQCPVAFPVCNVLLHLISFITDDEMYCTAPPFEPGGAWYGLTISNGAMLHPLADRSPDAVAPSLSFQKIWDELRKKIPLWYYIDYTLNVKPTLVINYKDELYNSRKAATYTSVEKIVTSFDVNKLYSVVEMGSGDTKEKKDDDCDHTPYYDEIGWLGPKEEKYIFETRANIDKSFSLKGDFTISTNLIKEVIYDNLTDHDETIFFIDGGEDTTEPLSDALLNVHVYNRRLFNDQVALRFKKEFPANIAQYYGPKTSGIKAVSTKDSDPTALPYLVRQTIEPIQFNDDYNLGFDASNTYGNGTTQGNAVSLGNSRFTAPSPGIYSLYLDVTVYGDVPEKRFNELDIELGFSIYNSSNVFITTLDELWQIYHEFSKRMSITKAIYLNTGDYVVPTMSATSLKRGFIIHTILTFPYTSVTEVIPEVFIKAGGVFQVDNVFQLSGVFQQADPDEYGIIKTTAAKPLTIIEYDFLKKSRFDLFTVKDAWGNAVIGHIENIKYSRKTNIATLSLLSTKNMLK